MLKTKRGDEIWLVSQPDHGEVSGLLAAHWGNEQFAAPGMFASTQNPARLGTETILSIAQHDNGWWEWEASPGLSPKDGLPLDLTELLRDQEEGMNRWRLGIPRFSSTHPYVSLLISAHAYWLYSHGSRPDPDSPFLHPLTARNRVSRLGETQKINASHFANEIKSLQAPLLDRLGNDPECASWIEDRHLFPHVRLLQILDGISLALCSGLVFPPNPTETFSQDLEFRIPDVPRQSWEDRVTLEVRASSPTRYTCSPYPFAKDPVRLGIPAKIFSSPALSQPTDLSRLWYATEKQRIACEITSI